MNTSQSVLEEAVLKFPIGMVVLCPDDAGKIRSATVLEINPAAAKFLNVTPDSAKGKMMEEFPAVAGEHFLEANLASADSSAPVDLEEVRASQLPGQGPSLQVRVFHLSAGRYCLMFQDITERRQREAADLWARSELENRARERAADLIRVNERLRSEICDRQAAEDQLRALAARLHKAQEAERIRLAREIHDALGQLCTALKIDITFIARKLSKSDGRLGEKVQSALSLVDNLIRSLRQLSAELHPSTLQALGLFAAMEWQAQEFQRHTGIQFELHLPEKEVELDLERSTAVFRIFQESLTNVARHSEATTVQAALAVRDGMLTLVVQDNGKGFDTTVAGARGSLGLLSMRERAHLFGGKLRIMSTLGKGVTVLLDAPLKGPDKVRS